MRLRFSGLPCELAENFDPRFPILVGGLAQVRGTLAVSCCCCCCGLEEGFDPCLPILVGGLAQVRASAALVVKARHFRALQLHATAFGAQADQRRLLTN